VAQDEKTASLTPQENNAVAVIGLESASVTRLRPLGYKDHSRQGVGLDAGDRDGSGNTRDGAAGG